MSEKAQLRADRQRAALELLASQPQGMQKDALWEAVESRFPTQPHEAGTVSNGAPRAKIAYLFQTSAMVWAKWITKERGIWRITDAGRQALKQYPDARSLMQAANDAYASAREAAADGGTVAPSIVANPAAGASRSHVVIRALLEVLAAHQEPVFWSEAVAELQGLAPPEGSENEVTKNGQTRYVVNARWWSVGPTKVGWMTKQGVSGLWAITEAGRQALTDYPDPLLFGQALDTAYQEAMAAQKGQQDVAAAVAAIPVGSWTSFTDLSQVSGQPATSIGLSLWKSNPSGWHRVLSKEGKVTADSYPNDPQANERAERQRELLTAEGIACDPSAQPELYVDAGRLQTLIQAGSAGQRAWLVRGSNVDGHNLVPVWLEDDFISRPATNIKPLEEPITREDVEAAVGEAMSSRSSDYRRRRVEEYDRFLRRMDAGDLVVTTSEGRVFVGVVNGSPEWVDDSPLPAKLRRSVEWRTDPDGVLFSDLPEPLPDRLKTPEDVADMTPDLGTITKLVPEPSAEREVPAGEAEVTEVEVEPVAAMAELALPTEELADALHIPLSWLDDTTRILQRRNQVIFYGPPGTGKTYVATRLAEHFTEGNNVRIVQFHPSYTYEDFIAGYRPVEVDGNVVFRLRQGPLMQMAEQARDNPGTPYVLIIDEINRANLAKVFGELYFLLEYRDQSIELLYGDEGSEAFSLPRNLFIIGTMNTADRSIALVDAAMRRRFAFRHLHPDSDPVKQVLPRWLTANFDDFDVSAKVLARLNELLDARDYAIGPSYFMKTWISDLESLEDVWDSDILPLLEEHHAGEGLDVAQQYSLLDILAEVGAAAEPESDEPAEDDAANEAAAMDVSADATDDEG